MRHIASCPGQAMANNTHIHTLSLVNSNLQKAGLGNEVNQKRSQKNDDFLEG